MSTRLGRHAAVDLNYQIAVVVRYMSLHQVARSQILAAKLLPENQRVVRDPCSKFVLVDQRSLLVHARVVEPLPVGRESNAQIDSAGQLIFELLTRFHIEDAHRAFIRAALAHVEGHQRSVARHVLQVH